MSTKYMKPEVEIEVLDDNTCSIGCQYIKLVGCEKNIECHVFCQLFKAVLEKEKVKWHQRCH